jgi:hypothetical protein
VRRLRLAAVPLAIGLVALAPGRMAGSPGDVRAGAARWLAGYDRALAALVATETSTQRVFRRNTVGEHTITRVMRSEFAWVPVLGGRDTLGVRDVREMDGQPVGEPGRLEALLRAPGAERDSRVAALLGESVRLLEVPTAVNFNFPTFALGYLRDVNAERAKWNTKNGPSPGLVALRFKESDRSLVRTPEGRTVKAEGTLVVETATGRVRETSVVLNDAHAVDVPAPGTEMVRYEARVRYADDAHVGAWVPTEMVDRYEWRRRASESGAITNALLVDGKATYTQYRRYGTEGKLLR